MVRYLFFILAVASCFLSPAIALFIGIAFALVFKSPFLKQSKKVSKYLLQVAVVGLGFGINLHESLAVGKEGMIFTIISVTGVMLIGYLLGRILKLQPKLSYLISSGTAICGGSAIAAISPIVKANEDETSMSLAVIFTLNAVALFLFPPVGRMLGLTQEQFGMWAAIAIHDTSSVVGAGAEYGAEALKVATMVKLTRALWIIPLSLVSIFIFNRNNHKKISVPWFIFLFILAMIVNTYFSIPEVVLQGISFLSHKLLSLTLFLIGSTLSIAAIRNVGIKPVVLGISLWIIISLTSLLVIV
ncbi:MAG: putative sulfate exporter family transporter [Bacteroidales bacterium]|nr:putative sulfate exporter family transporter [Bacteroidales bacterium]